MRETGIYQILGNVRFFIPHPLPVSNPPFSLTPEITDLYGKALFALGKLNEVSNKLPSPQRFIKAYVIKEALLSSAIEGIHTTLLDVFTQATHQTLPDKNTQLVLNYTKALDAALELLSDNNLPLVSRVILKAHEALMSNENSASASPGEFRKQTVRVGNLTPPPATEIQKLMSDLEKYINNPSDLPPLIKAGLVHVQFETIHPFLDGNGRIGRLLIVLMLMQNTLLNQPVLYPSYYFKKHRSEYYHRLDRVRTTGDFEGWILYYLKAIEESADDAYARPAEIEALEKHLKEHVQNDPEFTKTRETALATLDALFAQPVITAGHLAEIIGKAYNTAQSMLKLFCLTGIVHEVNANKRNKLYKFSPYLELLERD